MPPDDTTRAPLTRDRVLRAAVALADREGLGALTMRRLGAELGVEAMSLYKHVANKDAILDGIVELVIGDIELPAPDAGWRSALRQQAGSVREVLRRHAWAIALVEERRSAAPARARYLDATLGTLRSAGFSDVDAGYAFWLLDSFVYGHVVQETSMPDRGDSAADELEADDGLPHLAAVENAARRSAFSVDGAFAFGLDLILDALDARRAGG